MPLDRKDFAATALTALAVATFAATHEAWNVWLVGDSRRWAAVAISVIGIVACGLGSPGKDVATWILVALGTAAGVLAAVAIVTGSLTALSFLTLDIVVLWAASLVRHAAHGRAQPV
jgi:hypothetical protein